MHNKKERKLFKKATKREAAAPGYIISPAADFWLSGGISIAAMILLLIYIAAHGAAASADKSALLGSVFIWQALINWPHFMGAYGLLYRPAGNIRKFRLAALYVPLVLAALVVLSVMTGGAASWGAISVNQELGYFVWLGAAFYLAWHYTGQSWGMIATFLRLSNSELSANERLAVRGGLRMLLIWHVVWGAQDLPEHWLGGLHAHLPALLSLMNVLCMLAFAAGAIVWFRLGKRLAKMPDRRILASWASIYLWYLVLYFMPAAYIVVQLSHALQYLAFPLRVELNRVSLSAKTEFKKSAWSLRYYLMLVVSGALIFYLPAYASDASQKYTFALIVASVVSIHHYFVDSCIWKVSNPEVRKQLFAHLPFPTK